MGRRALFQGRIRLFLQVIAQVAQSLRALCSCPRPNLLKVSHIEGRIDVFQDKSPEGDILRSKGTKPRHGVPAVDKNARYRFAVAFADDAIITMPG